MSLHGTLIGLILCPDKLAHQFVDAPQHKRQHAARDNDH